MNDVHIILMNVFLLINLLNFVYLQDVKHDHNKLEPKLSKKAEIRKAPIKTGEASIKNVGKVQLVNKDGDFKGKEQEQSVESPTEESEKQKHRSELVFGIEGGETTCFSEKFSENIIEKNFTFEYQVLRGSYVRVSLLSPKEEILWSSELDHFYGNTTFLTSSMGLFQFCFVNDHYWHLDTTYIYIRLEPTNLDPGRIRGKNSSNIGGPELVAEITSEGIYKQLSRVRLLQNAYRLRMQSGRYNAMVLNSRVGYFTTFSTALMILVGFGQTFWLKRMFGAKASASNLMLDKRPRTFNQDTPAVQHHFDCVDLDMNVISMD